MKATENNHLTKLYVPSSNSKDNIGKIEKGGCVCTKTIYTYTNVKTLEFILSPAFIYIMYIFMFPLCRG